MNGVQFGWHFELLHNFNPWTVLCASWHNQFIRPMLKCLSEKVNLDSGKLLNNSKLLQTTEDNTTAGSNAKIVFRCNVHSSETRYREGVYGCVRMCVCVHKEAGETKIIGPKFKEYGWRIREIYFQFQNDKTSPRTLACLTRPSSGLHSCVWDIPYVFFSSQFYLLLYFSLVLVIRTLLPIHGASRRRLAHAKLT